MNLIMSPVWFRRVVRPLHSLFIVQSGTSMTRQGLSYSKGKAQSRRIDTASKIAIASLAIVVLIAVILYFTGLLDYTSPNAAE
jgi:hypothetical protein